MHLFEYLKKNDFMSQHSVCFVPVAEQSKFAEEQKYPLLFFSLFFNHLKKRHDQYIVPLSLHDTEPDMIMSQLAMSFLGSMQMYWFGDISKLEAKKNQRWTDFLSKYQGPHTVFFFTDETGTASTYTVQIPSKVSAQDYEQLVLFFKPELQPKNKMFIAKVFAEYESITLDTACLLMSYQEVVGAHVAEFAHDWLIKMVPSEKSLFTLSQYFFAKDGQSFFELWQHIKDDYPEVFWISYWSEQVWRAYYFIKFSQQKNIVEAKKVSFKLPFSFIQRDWKSCKLAELSTVHEKLYALDTAIKNGASDIGLESIYTDFLA